MDTAIGTLTPFLFFNLTKPVPHHILFGVSVVKKNIFWVRDKVLSVVFSEYFGFLHQ